MTSGARFREEAGFSLSGLEVDDDVIMLTWVYKDSPLDAYYEIITLESDTHRCRTWQHFENGEFAKLTVIDEIKVG